MRMTFQGGFVGKETVLMGQDRDGKWGDIDTFLCLDINDEQVFSVSGLNVTLSRLRLVFRKSTDFFGRITIYNLDILSTK